MKIIDELLLEEFRRKTQCEWCGRYSGTGLDPHHLWGRGMGGGSRLDVRANLISLCRACHNQVHLGRIKRVDLVEVVAKREGMSAWQIKDEIHRLRSKAKP